MRKKLIAAVLGALVLAGTAQAAATTVSTPFEADITACSGGTIHLSGQLLTVFTATANGAGGFVFSTHTQPQGIHGVDLQTGTKYLGTGLTRDLIVLSPSGVTTLTLVNRFHIQATGGAQSFDVSETLHVTALADGTITAFVDNFSAPC